MMMPHEHHPDPLIEEHIPVRDQSATQASQLAAIVDSSDDAIVSKDLNGIIMSWNRGAERLFGYTAEEVIGRSITILIPPGSDNEELAILEHIRNGERVDHYETVRVRKDGSLVDISLTVSPVRDAAGKIVGASKIARDITLRKRIEAELKKSREELTQANDELEKRVRERTAQLESAHNARLKDWEEKKALEEQLIQAQKLESIGTLAAGVAHDFNNVLNVIRAYTSDLLERPTTDPDCAKDLETIDQATIRGASIVRQLLTLARKTESDLLPADLNAIISSLADLLSKTFPKTVNISLDLHPRLPTILADANQLTQALLNLCLNSRDAMPNGGQIAIRTKLADGASIKNVPLKQTAYVCIEVTDTGHGINGRDITRIFEPFFTTKKLGEGSGLGLAMTYGLVKGHGGFMDVESQPDRGTTMSVFLPVPAAPLQTSQARRTYSIEEGQARTVLVAEDEEPLVELLRRRLSGHGYSVLTARDGAETISLYQKQPGIDLVLLDMGLPKFDGLEVMEKIRELNPSAKFVVTSGYLDPTIKAKLQQAGVLHFIDKPYTLDAVLEVLGRYSSQPT